MSTFVPRDPRFAERVREIFGQAPFIAALGIELGSFGPGWCETHLSVAPRHLQQDGLIHAGVQATMADHTAGAAAGTLLAPGEIVLTVEFKINLLRPAAGEALRCRAEVVRPGKTLTVAESSVFVVTGAEERLVAKLLATMAFVPRGA
jgi:uncharacterized protein (TIGR00369 family)